MNTTNELMIAIIKLHLIKKINNSSIRIDKLLTNNEKLFLIEFTKHIMPLNMNYSIGLRAHFIFYDLINFPKCIFCLKELSDPKYFRSFMFGYTKACCLRHGLLSKSTRIKHITTYIKNHKSNNQNVDIASITNIFLLNSVKTKIQLTFSNNYGIGIINPGLYFNRHKGYDSYLKNIYVEPLFSYNEYNDMCKHIDRYHNKNLKWKCKTCGLIFYTNVKTKSIKPDGIHSTGISCPICHHNKLISKYEFEVLSYIKTFYDENIEHNNRSILKAEYCNKWIDNHEIDIWIPNKNLAIEINGTYFHMDPRFYHSNDIFKNDITAKMIWENDKIKYDILSTLKIKLYIIWEYDWIHNLLDVKTNLKNLIINI